MPREPVDVVLLTHERLDHLRRTVHALLERTPEPIRLTVVDNASGADVRGWLADNRHLFARIIPRPVNEHVPAFQHGIDATTSDPLVVTDPDLVVPDLRPSWLARLRALMERHPDFGLIAVELDPANNPLSEEEIAVLRGPVRRVDDDLAEGNVGTHLQLLRRSALREPYVSDRQVCDAVRRAGFRVGWATGVQALHLGFDDVREHPDYLARKHRRGEFYPDYGAVLRTAPPPPTLTELAAAAPAASALCASGVPADAVLELAWGVPLVAPVVPGVRAVLDPPARLPLEDRCAGAVVLVDPPADRIDALLAEAARLAGSLVLLACDLATVGARLPDELARQGWHGTEHEGAGELALAMARAGDDALGELASTAVLEHRERLLELFAEGAFGRGPRRLFAFRPAAGAGPAGGLPGDLGGLRTWRRAAPPERRRPAPPAGLRARLRRRRP